MGLKLTFKLIRNYNHICVIGIFIPGVIGPLTTLVLSAGVWDQFKSNPSVEFGEDL